MQVHWLNRLLILALTAVIVLPCEEDGTFDLAFLDVKGSEVHSALAKRIEKKETTAQLQCDLDSQEFALCLRSRYDFLDLVFSDFFELSKTEVEFFQRNFFAPKTQYNYLLSSLLLNLPPPIA
ncbi:hypothetical protein A0128_08490 [Leptospira tipperaryensis]|uniref:Uncharacterized protein n=1 Tax=Leptospira tipperaryensis TaxID=2564040 RepID=A0A1D7UWF8_9LEPT|nr:hypothetical protein [Leptospira tipperaryensis]AOP33875.1 hypothetical protein A0128_08490 [Leptospira tipperaryensis]